MIQKRFKKLVSYGVLILLFSGCSRSWYVNDASTEGDVFTKAAGDKEKGNGSVNKPFLTIEEAVQKASPGDTIFIDSGFYFASTDEIRMAVITLNRPQLNMEGAGPNKTIIQMPANEDEFQCGIKIEAEKTKLQNLSIKGGTMGVFIHRANEVIIRNVITEGQTDHGFLLDGTQESEISRCQAQKSGFRGFQIINSAFNKIHNNISQDNENAGFCLIRSTNNYLQQNIAQNNSMSGFYINGWNQSNRFENNQAISNALGGFYLNQESEKNQLKNNLSQGNGVGVSINNSHGNVIVGNQISSNIGNGIVFKSGSQANQAINNQLKNNKEHQIRVSEEDAEKNQIENNVIEN